jgi:hypothetical protein
MRSCNKCVLRNNFVASCDTFDLNPFRKYLSFDVSCYGGKQKGVIYIDKNQNNDIFYEKILGKTSPLFAAVCCCCTVVGGVVVVAVVVVVAFLE